jgi:hypothetical protein
MFETLKRLWIEGTLTEEKLDNAVLKGWIDEQQEQEIIILEQENGLV